MKTDDTEIQAFRKWFCDLLASKPYGTCFTRDVLRESKAFLQETWLRLAKDHDDDLYNREGL